MKTKLLLIGILAAFGGFPNIFGQLYNYPGYASYYKELGGVKYVLEYKKNDINSFLTISRESFDNIRKNYVRDQNSGGGRFERDLRPDIKQMFNSSRRDYFRVHKVFFVITTMVGEDGRIIGAYIMMEKGFFDDSGTDENKISLADVDRIINFMEKQKAHTTINTSPEKNHYIDLDTVILFK